jgi:hypothetical protein
MIVVRFAVKLIVSAVIIGVIFGMLGTLLVCRPDSLFPENFQMNGQCQATDTPREVFASFAILGLLAVCVVSLLVWVMVWLGRKIER